MASKFIGIFGLLALASGAMAGLATYAASPYGAYHYSAAAAPLVYHQAASPAHAVVHSYNAPLFRSYAAAPIVKAYAGAPIATSHYSPIVRSYAAPAVLSAPVVAKAAVVAAPAPALVKSVVAAPAVELEGSPRYDFSYGVHDSYTGDIKNQVESRNGGNVAGSYSVVDADGYKRTVTYTADDFNGFNAVVQREPLVKYAVPAAVATPVHHVQHPVQQQIQYLPAQQQFTTVQQQVQQEYLPQAPAQSEPVPVEYPEQAQQEPAQQQPEQQYPQDQQYPPFPQFENPQQQGGNADVESDDDTEVVETRSLGDNAASASTVAPAPVNEDQKDAIPPKRTA